MTTSGEVNSTVTDGALGLVDVPPAKTQVVMGCSSSGTVAQCYQTTSKTALIANFGYGPGVEAACIKIDAGGTVIFMRTTATTPGASGAVTAANNGSSVCTVSVATAFDDYRVIMKVVAAGTVGTAGITFQLSLDAGRTYGPVLALGTAVTYAIAQTGLTLAFAAGTMLAGGTYSFTTTAPLWGTSDLAACFTALQASPLSWGAGIHVVGTATGANATTVQGYLDTLFAQFRYTFAMLDTADATGGLLANEATWITALQADFAAVSANRICAGAGYANIQSSITTPVCGAPVYRRPFTWAAARRVVQVPIYEHLGRVRTGALGVCTFPSTPDTYLYHDERVTSGLDGTRFMAAVTRIRKPGVFVKNPRMMAAPGSDFSQLQFRQVMDVACVIGHDVLSNYINDNVRLYPVGDPKAGFIVEQDARAIEIAADVAYSSFLVGTGAASDAFLTVTRNDNLLSTNILTAKVTVESLGYIYEIDLSLGFTNPAFVGN